MFMRNGWYVAALSREVTTKPLGRMLLNQPLVIYRTGGTPAILSDICPHRGAMLSRGWVAGETISCGYHGFTFDTEGSCVRIPGQEKIPAGANVRHYPVVESWGWLFVWMGDPERAMGTPLPDYHWLQGPDWVGRDDMLGVRSDYTMVRDNLLDLTHAQFVHQRTLATAAVTETPLQAVLVDGMVRVTRDMRDIEPSPFFRALGGFKGRVDHHQTIEFTPPCHVIIKVRVADVGGGDIVCNMRVLNALTPETDSSTVVFLGTDTGLRARRRECNGPGVHAEPEYLPGGPLSAGGAAEDAGDRRSGLRAGRDPRRPGVHPGRSPHAGSALGEVSQGAVPPGLISEDTCPCRR